jgi:uncharacterized protein involved in exopolysaccharide biosynthesis
MTLDQVMAALWRRRALIGAMTVVIFAIGAAIVFATPSVYKASVVVRMDQMRPSAELVQKTVDDSIEYRVFTVRQQLLGRPVLQKAIETLNLYPEVVSRSGMDAAVEAMRSDMEVKVEGTNAFEVTYTAYDARTAAKVANRLPEILAEQEVQLRLEDAQRATELFASEVAALQAGVTEWETKITKFKIDHLGELPEQIETNMRNLERIAGEMRLKSEQLATAETRRSELARSNYTFDTEAGRMLASESTLTRELVAARSQWTADHPEIKRLNTEAEAMRQKRQEAEGRMGAERQERARSAVLVTRIEGEIGRLQKQAEVIQARLERTPRWTQELGVMQRDYEATKTKYQSILSRKIEAELAQELEAKHSKRLFNVISPAFVPTTPARPDRPTWLMLAFLISLGLSVLMAVVLETRDDSVHDLTQIKQRLPLPILAIVPLMNSKPVRRVLLPATENSSTAELN